MFWNTKKNDTAKEAMIDAWPAKNLLYTNEAFKVMKDTFFDPASEQYIQGYGVYNTQTDTREAEARRLVTAIALADMFHDATVNYKKPQLDKHLPPTPSILTPAQSATIQ